MSSFPKISIIIPSYNKGLYVEQTLKSIFLQKYPNLEVIIQDGGSTDGSLKIIKKYMKKYNKCIKFESKKDNGQLDAINIGLKKATGDIISFINADDIYLNNSFNNITRRYLKNRNCYWFCGRGIVIDKNNSENTSIFYKFFIKPYKNLLLSINNYSILLCVNYLMQPSVFLNKSVLNKFGIFSGTNKFVTEYEMWLKLGKVEMPIVVKEYLSGFRMAGDNITANDHVELLQADHRIVKKYTNNIIFLFLHRLNNLGRVISLGLIRK
jgi:glycosyltransferase involved in cell wall biosynthesis